MKKESDDKIIYSLNVADVQEVAKEVLERKLTKKEIDLVERKVGGFIDWYQAIENSICFYITQGIKK